MFVRLFRVSGTHKSTKLLSGKRLSTNLLLPRFPREQSAVDKLAVDEALLANVQTPGCGALAVRSKTVFKSVSVRSDTSPHV